MKFGVVTFPGSNCDQDMIDALRYDLNQEVIGLWHKDKDLSMFSTQDCILLPGGFSYGDHLRCGAIAKFSPIMQSVVEFANRGGRVIGVCNGFQILCEAGLLPGVLLRNQNQQFICKNVYLKSENTTTSLTKDITGRPLMIPIAHGEGRYYADDATVEELFKNNQVVFRYCDEFGNIIEQANPNGALRNIAGISNKAKNVFGMMPHPERATSSLLGNTDGQQIFQSLINNN
ncbi:phosphoribosylformylglycinamidine synthase subunit PurQ [uncultured Chitinophaga sp.]|uniref:phosphoribosylformylglycinamidine synthase subunit PurQ n=1 Tax=uncultured Chitinophaga sp. TaxID=339340 RepID=UPI0025DC128F|nr:phosphoribosylformylglycinamidine synthase subunit PurQ [uncultured Chitinophaga sp.]